jgi:pimeloyl-ACP methyl ester carboxylesterase
MGAFSKIKKALVAGGAGIAALAAVNAAVARTKSGNGKSDEAEPDKLGGEPFTYHWKHGQIHYRVAGDVRARPVVFIHGVDIGASSFMWRRNFAELAADFRVYAFDLLGFGFSDKPPMAHYSSELYTDLITDFIHDVVGAPARIIASSLGAAYAVHAAAQHPLSIDSLLLIAPTGAAGVSQTRPGVTGAAFYGLLHSPVLGTSFYNAMASERSLREQASKALFYDKRFVTERLLARSYTLSHQPGAQYALTAFFSGYLNTDLRDAFARAPQPITLVWGKQDTANPPANAQALLQLNPRASLEVFDHARALPQEEHAQQFNSLVRQTFQARIAAA